RGLWCVSGARSPCLVRRLGGAMAVLVVQVLGGACLLAIAVVAPIFEIAAAASVMRNVFANLAWPMQQSTLMTSVVAEERASAAGIGFAVWGLANAAGPALAGVLIQNGSLDLPLVLGAIAYAGGALAVRCALR